jgi:hypothetical protein
MRSQRTVVAIVLLTHTWEVLGSNFGWDIYHVEIPSGFLHLSTQTIEQFVKEATTTLIEILF